MREPGPAFGSESAADILSVLFMFLSHMSRRPFDVVNGIMTKLDPLLSFLRTQTASSPAEGFDYDQQKVTILDSWSQYYT